jgi:hypothetical protein
MEEEEIGIVETKAKVDNVDVINEGDEEIEGNYMF